MQAENSTCAEVTDSYFKSSHSVFPTFIFYSKLMEMLLSIEPMSDSMYIGAYRINDEMKICTHP